MDAILSNGFQCIVNKTRENINKNMSRSHVRISYAQSAVVTTTILDQNSLFGNVEYENKTIDKTNRKCQGLETAIITANHLIQ